MISTKKLRLNHGSKYRTIHDTKQFNSSTIRIVWWIVFVHVSCSYCTIRTSYRTIRTSNRMNRSESIRIVAFTDTNVPHNDTSHDRDSCCNTSCDGVGGLSRGGASCRGVSHYPAMREKSTDLGGSNSHGIIVSDGGIASKIVLCIWKTENPRIFSGLELGLF